MIGNLQKKVLHLMRLRIVVSTVSVELLPNLAIGNYHITNMSLQRLEFLSPKIGSSLKCSVNPSSKRVNKESTEDFFHGEPLKAVIECADSLLRHIYNYVNKKW